MLGILADLSDDDLRRPCCRRDGRAPEWSGTSPLMSNGSGSAVSRREPIDLDISDDAIWNVRADQQVAAVLDDYRQEIEHADAIISATTPDAAPAWWPEELFPGFRLHTLRQIVLHVITETACHAGHLDAVRGSSTPHLGVLTE